MARVLITGASGLIGRSVQSHWPVDGDDLVAVSHLDHDLLDPDAFVAAIVKTRPTVVLHLAWASSGRPGYRTDPDNMRWVTSTHRAAIHCLEQGMTFYATGSVVDQPGMAPDLYSRSKQHLRALMADAIRSGDVGWLRPFYIFDPEIGRPAVLSAAIAARSEGRPVELNAPAARHDFVHASDVGAAIVAVVSHRMMGSLDIGSGRLRSVAQLVESCGAAWRPGMGAAAAAVQHDDSVARIDRLEAVGWQPRATDEFFND